MPCFHTSRRRSSSPANLYEAVSHRGHRDHRGKPILDICCVPSLAHTLRASFGRPNPLPADLWGQSKNTANPVDRIAVLSSIFTLTPSIKIAIPTGVRYFCDGIHYPTSRVNASLTFALIATNSSINSLVWPSSKPMPLDSTAFCKWSDGIVLLAFKSIKRIQISAFFR